ncbi:MAG: hypothetical protein PVF27_01560 [Gemmatimonadales bacterium]
MPRSARPAHRAKALLLLGCLLLAAGAEATHLRGKTASGTAVEAEHGASCVTVHHAAVCPLGGAGAAAPPSPRTAPDPPPSVCVSALERCAQVAIQGARSGRHFGRAPPTA